MIQRGQWRVWADEPKTPLGWIVGLDRWHGIPVYVLVAGECALTFLLNTWLPQIGNGSLAMVLTMGSLLGFMIAVQPRRRSPQPPNPAPDVCYPCRIRLDDRGRKLGIDRGYVAFSGGWLLYEGQRLSFSLKPSDLHSIEAKGRAPFLRLIEEQRVEFWSATQRTPFAHSLALWAEGPNPEGHSRLPPLTSNFEERCGLASWAAFFSAVFAGSGIGLSLAVLPMNLDSAAVIGLTVGCGLISALAAIVAKLLAGRIVQSTERPHVI